MILTGGCACGAVRFEVRGAPGSIADCHCRMCQRTVGAAVVAWASVPSSSFQLVHGAPTFWRSSAAAERGFCDRCGASLLFRPFPTGDQLDVAVAAFDQPEELAPTAAIWTSSRQPWVHLDPALPAFDESGPDWTPAVPPPMSPATPLRWQEGGPVDLVQLGALFETVGFSRRNDPGSLQAAIDGARWVVTAWHREQLIAFGRAISDGVSNGYVSAVAVRPDWQRRGVGRELVLRLIHGRDQVRFALRTSPAGERLYRSLGFEPDPTLLTRPRR